ncbi:MAG: hypothetical protein QM831_22250 [Kofleriaceae bacterium]
MVLGLIDVPARDASVDMEINGGCPLTYTSVNDSYYRLISTPQLPIDSFSQCEGDLSGSTHLVAPDDAIEYANVRDFVAGQIPIGESVIVGAVQLPDQTAPDIGWLSITGGKLPAVWGPDQPNDGGNAPLERNKEQLAVLTVSANLMDVSNTPQGAVCECDRKPIDSSFRDTFTTMVMP